LTANVATTSRSSGTWSSGSATPARTLRCCSQQRAPGRQVGRVGDHRVQRPRALPRWPARSCTAPRRVPPRRPSAPRARGARAPPGRPAAPAGPARRTPTGRGTSSHRRRSRGPACRRARR
jgi:hypothetical protein